MNNTVGEYSLLLLNGGIGTRVGAKEPKQLLKVKGIPILVYSLVAADRTPEICEIVLNYPEGWKEAVADVVESYAIQKPVVYVPAGDSRHESVANMLPKARSKRIIIHESARPMVRPEDFSQLASSGADNVSYMLEIPFTVAPVDPEFRVVTGSLDRRTLRNVQLPQKFLKQDLDFAHEYARAHGLTFTEDATLVAESGRHVEFVDGAEENFKVTTPIDVRLATFLMQETEVEDE